MLTCMFVSNHCDSNRRRRTDCFQPTGAEWEFQTAPAGFSSFKTYPAHIKPPTPRHNLTHRLMQEWTHTSAPASIQKYRQTRWHVHVHTHTRMHRQSTNFDVIVHYLQPISNHTFCHSARGRGWFALKYGAPFLQALAFFFSLFNTARFFFFSSTS